PKSGARVLDNKGGKPGQNGEGKREVEIGDLVPSELQGPPASRADGPLDAQRAPDEIPVMNEYQADFRDNNRRDAEIGTLDPETRRAKQKRENSGEGAAQRDTRPRRDIVIDKQDCCGVCADAEIKGIAKRDLSAISAKDVPRLRHGRIDQKQD